MPSRKRRPMNVRSQGRTIIGKWLRRRRLELGLPLRRIGESMGLYNPNVISYWELGRYAIPVDRVEALADAYLLDRDNVRAWWLVARMYDSGLSWEGIARLLTEAVSQYSEGQARLGPGGGPAPERATRARLPLEGILRDFGSLRGMEGVYHDITPQWRCNVCGTAWRAIGKTLCPRCRGEGRRENV